MLASKGNKGDVEGGPGDRERGGDCFLYLCRCLNIVTGLACVLCLIAHAMALTVGPVVTADGELCKEQLLRLYSIGIAVSLTLVETEWRVILNLVLVMESWLARAIAHGFLAVLTLQLATSKGTSDYDRSVNLYRKVAGLCSLACASFYCLGGVLCFGALKQARYRRVMERVRVEHDLEKLDKQREELRVRLARQ